MRSKRIVLITISAVLALSVAIGFFFYLNSQYGLTTERETIDVAYSPFESTALFLVAQERGFFSQSALNITVHDYSSGALALEGVLKGEADIAVGTTEFPLVIRALNQDKIQTMATLSESNFEYLVGRVDRGIGKPSDLKGKVIGTTLGTIAQFFLGRFLVLNEINPQDVTIVDLKTPAEWVDAVVNGSVDAVATAQPYANSAKEALGPNAVVWSLHSNQPMYAQAIASREWINANPELCVRFLRALLKAEEFAINDPAQAKLIVKQHLNFSNAYIETVWSQNKFSLSLDQALILEMESEARWLISNNLTNQTEVPDFRDFVYTASLVSLKSQSVDIIGEGS